MNTDNYNYTFDDIRLRRAGLRRDTVGKRAMKVKSQNSKVKNKENNSNTFSLLTSPFSLSFVYDGWNPITELCTGVAPSTNYYTWGLDLSGSLQGAGGIGGLLAVTECNVGSMSQYFPSFDANGNVTDYIDETGEIAAHYEYNPFGLPVRDRTQTGGITSATGDKKDDFNFRFSTKYLDTETCLYYYGLRYYIPPLARWLNRDPINESGGENLFAAFLNLPLSRIDPLGTTISSADGAKLYCQKRINKQTDDANKKKKPEDPPDSDLTGCNEHIQSIIDGDLADFWSQFGEGCPKPEWFCECCSGSRGGGYSRDTGKIRICWNKRDQTDFQLVLQHEGYHRLQHCGRPFESKEKWFSCKGLLMKELEAYYCAKDKFGNKMCHSFYSCIENAMNSSCRQSKKDPDKWCQPDDMTPDLYKKLEAWFNKRKVNNELCKFPRKPDYPGL